MIISHYATCVSGAQRTPREILAGWIGRLILVSASLSIASPVLAIGTTPPSWEFRKTVATGLADFTAHLGADRTLAYDHHGNPGIAFYDAITSALRYARRVPGVGWVDTTVDNAAVVGLYPSLAYDRYERPAISYYDSGGNADLKFAHYDGSSWISETVDSPNGVGLYTSLAFDPLGRAAIAYFDAFNSSLKYVADTDGDFSFLDESPVTVVNDGNEGNHASLVFDSLSRPMIAHVDLTTGNLRFSIEEPGIGWTTANVDGASVYTEPSIAIDPDTDYPAIAYHDQSADVLRFAAWNGNAWNAVTVDNVGATGLAPSLAFDPADGNPAISYMNDSDIELKLAWHDGSSWQTQTVDTDGDVGRASSLAFNDFGSGFPSIAYLESLTGGNLYFIEDPPAVVPEPSSLMLLAIGSAVMWIRRRWRV